MLAYGLVSRQSTIRQKPTGVDAPAECSSPSMNADTPHDIDVIDLEEPEQITDVGELEVGDRLVLDDQVLPKTVVQTGARPIQARDQEDHIQHYVKVRGDWSDAKEIVLANQYAVFRHGDTGQVVDHATAEVREVERTHIAGSRDRVSGQRVSLTQ